MCTDIDTDSKYYSYYSYYSVRQDPGKAYKSKLHKNTHPVTVLDAWMLGIRLQSGDRPPFKLRGKQR